MREDAQARITELDISERLRLMMRERKLTVAGMAQAAGVSKSAMEKYLAGPPGPSSPRATAVASVCQELSASANLLLFTTPNDELRLMQYVANTFWSVTLQN